VATWDPESNELNPSLDPETGVSVHFILKCFQIY
jgi:hypothetical protein